MGPALSSGNSTVSSLALHLQVTYNAVVKIPGLSYEDFESAVVLEDDESALLDSYDDYAPPEVSVTPKGRK